MFGTDFGDVIETILARRSIRAYGQGQIEDDQLERILLCGLYAPSSGGRQLARFMVIQDADRMDRLNEIIRNGLLRQQPTAGLMRSKGVLRAQQEDYRFAYGAPTLICAIAPRAFENAMADCACALENMLIACESLGLSACWSNQTHWLTGEPELRAVFEELGMGTEEDIFGAIAVGRRLRESSPPAAKRVAGRVIRDKLIKS